MARSVRSGAPVAIIFHRLSPRAASPPRRAGGCVMSRFRERERDADTVLGKLSPDDYKLYQKASALIGRVSTDAILRTLATRLGDPEVRYTLWRLFRVEQRTQQETAEVTKAAADVSRARALSSLVQALEA